jgi:peptidoglycan pentaglycine glycine transferase (the first glycine)
MARVTLDTWNQFLETREDVHILQTGTWGKLKEKFGWLPYCFICGNSGAQILLKKLPLGFHIAYLPFGPLGSPSDSLLDEIRVFCKRQRCIFLKVEPDVWQDSSNSTEMLDLFIQFSPSKSIQPPNTIVIDLKGTEEEWLTRMKQKTRYNIRLAEKKGVVIQESESVDTFYELMLETGERDEFGVHDKHYYQLAFDLFHPAGQCKLFIATYEEIPLAGIMVFISGPRAWYFYGASNAKERNLMPTYLLQWKAMQYCAKRGCETYDLWGIPDVDEDTLEANFMQRNDGLWSVYRFKRGFGGRIKRLAGAWDDVYIKPLYLLYRWWISRHEE